MEYFCQWLEGKKAPVQVAVDDDHHMCKCNGVFAPLDVRKTPPAQVAKGQDQHWCQLKQDAPTTCNYNHYHHRPDQNQHVWVLLE